MAAMLQGIMSFLSGGHILSLLPSPFISHLFQVDVKGNFLLVAER